MAAFALSAALPSQFVLAGPAASPAVVPLGQVAAKACIKKGKAVSKTPKSCIVKLGPVAPPPGGI